MPCRLSVFIPSRWYHASRGQTWHPRASMAHFFPCFFSQSVVCVSLNPRASTIPSVPCRLSVFIPSRWYHASRESKSSVCFTIPLVPCRLSVFIPSRWYHASRGQTWHPRASMAHFFPCTFSQSVVCVSLNPRASTIPSVPCRFSVFIPSRWYHASRGQTWSPRASMAKSLPCLFSQSLLCVSLKARASTIPSVPCRLSVFIPSRWYHASRGQTWHPRASTTQSVPCLFSQSFLCVSRSHLCHVGSVCSSYLGGTTHLVDKRGALEQARPNVCHVFSVKVLRVFLLTLEQAQSHLCHVGSVCSCHLGGTTHLVDKRGTLEQARPNLSHVFSVKVFCVFHDPICAMSAQCVHPISVVPRISWTNVAPSSKHDPICPMSFQSKFSVCFTIPFVPCRLSVFILSRWYHASRGQTWSPRASTTQCVPCLFSQSFACVSLNPRASTIPSVPCRLSVFMPSRWYHASRGQTWHPRASTTQSVPCLFSQSLLCVSRSHLCHVGSVCSSHLGGTTHLVDKRGTLEQARPNLSHVFSVKVFCVFHDPICAMSAQCVHPISVVPRISWTNVEPSSKHDPMCAMSFQSKFCVCFS